MIKLIACDMDGTLLNTEHAIVTAASQTLAKLAVELQAAVAKFHI